MRFLSSRRVDRIEDADREEDKDEYLVYTSYPNESSSDEFAYEGEDANRVEFEKLCGSFRIYKIDPNKLVSNTSIIKSKSSLLKPAKTKTPQSHDCGFFVFS